MQAEALLAFIETRGMLPREVELVYFMSQMFSPKSDVVNGTRVDFFDAGQSFSRLLWRRR